MAGVKVELDGGEKLLRLFKKVQGTPLSEALGQAVFMTANDVLNESKRIVPVDLGVLHESGRVSEPKMDADGFEVEVSYGGAAAPYAAIVHEDMRPKKFKKPGTGPKYLEKPVLEYAPKFVRKVMERYATYLRAST